ncbi:hypothetical protein J7J26_00005, partial [Candidatus Micrarchaeota archaeon]|nr:hypothetical protein [Candidatus Micrarchaeota archaeon]
YHQRSKVETVFSVIKRKFGDELYARNINMRKKEVKLKHLVYNLYRKIIFLLDVFYTADWIGLIQKSMKFDFKLNTELDKPRRIR